MIRPNAPINTGKYPAYDKPPGMGGKTGGKIPVHPVAASLSIRPGPEGCDGLRAWLEFIW